MWALGTGLVYASSKVPAHWQNLKQVCVIRLSTLFYTRRKCHQKCVLSEMWGFYVTNGHGVFKMLSNFLRYCRVSYYTWLCRCLVYVPSLTISLYSIYSTMNVATTISRNVSFVIICGWGMWQAWERRVMYAGFWWETRKERDHLKDPSVDRRILLKLVLKHIEWNALDWLHVA